MTDNDFDTQRTELANRFASAGAEFLGQMPLAAAALAEVPNTQPQQYAMVGEPKAIRALLPDDMPARRMRHGQRPTEPLEWEPPAIANKAEVDLDAGFLQWVHDRMRFAHGEDENYDYMHKLRAIIASVPTGRNTPNVASIATPPATTGASTVVVDEFVRLKRVVRDAVESLSKAGSPVCARHLDEVVEDLGRAIRKAGASTVLTDERISEALDRARLNTDSHCESLASEPSKEYSDAYFFRQIQREVAAQAGQVAVPGWISIAEHLPELHVTVALLDENRWMNTGSSDHNVNWHGAGYLCEFGQKYWSVFGETRSQCLDAVTHWMPLPAAPSPAKESK